MSAGRVEFETNQDIVNAFNALAVENDHLIVELKTERIIQTPQYFLISKKDENNIPSFEIQETMITQTSTEYLLNKNVFPNPKIKALPEDVFNLKTTFRVKSFEDIVRLHNAQKVEVQKYSVFGEALPSRLPLQILYENNLVLNKVLKEIFDEILNPKNNLLEVQETLSIISSCYEKLKKLNVNFTPLIEPVQGFFKNIYIYENIKT